jgi:hypothetical protein
VIGDFFQSLNYDFGELQTTETGAEQTVGMSHAPDQPAAVAFQGMAFFVKLPSHTLPTICFFDNYLLY